jgi:uncharacterized protein DUF5681
MANRDDPPGDPDGNGNGDGNGNDRGDYAVGYGKPPRKNQFQPGQSGNPKGRPRGAKGLKAELREELNEWVTITAEGKTKRIRKRRLILKALAAKAAKGNVAAADRLIALIIQMEGIEDERPGRRSLTENDQLILDQLLREHDDGSPVVDPTPDTDEVPE